MSYHVSGILLRRTSEVYDFWGMVLHVAGIQRLACRTISASAEFLIIIRPRRSVTASGLFLQAEFRVSSVCLSVRLPVGYTRVL